MFDPGTLASISLAIVVPIALTLLLALTSDNAAIRRRLFSDWSPPHWSFGISGVRLLAASAEAPIDMLQGGPASPSSVDIVEISRKGTSFHYQGAVWNKSALSLGADHCTDPLGNKCRIAPLSRHCSPAWTKNSRVIVKETAKERYNLWLSRSIRPPR